jgi:ring-1,2-phenylacetyl-CoA epoxidase subunit PaaC
MDRDDHRAALGDPGGDLGVSELAELVSSYADNKGALGRRYGEWAVSAPTVEAAVAAAAMAQDELGHARATYPVLAKLGVERADDTLDSSGAMRFIAEELPDWAAMIAANLVVDGILTTWVASVRDSEIEALAQRARKILQEEGAHKVHAEAWARRFCRSADRDLLLQRIGEAWQDAARWPGCDDAIREQVRSWLSELLAGEGCAVELPDPLTCPFCESPDVEEVSQFGGQIITRQVRCRACNTHFEAVREEFS